MSARQVLISAVVLLSLTRLDRQRAKALTRSLAIGGCRRVLGALSPRYAFPAGTALVFAPHQDDETLGCGGLIARKRQEGLPVHVAFITDGGASHPDHPEMSPAELSALRRREALAALAVLGVESGASHFLDEPDGSLDRLAGPRQADLVNRLAALLDRIEPDEVFLPCSPDGSSEHEAAFTYVCAALRRRSRPTVVWQYPVWSWRNPLLLLRHLCAAAGRCQQPTEDFGPIKQQALQCYRSQITPLPPWTEPALPADLVALFQADTEFFFRYELSPAAPAAKAARVI